MNPFAVKLAEHLKEDGRTVARICRESHGLKLSTVHAYKDGRRVPASMIHVDSLIEALHLTGARRDFLVRCYRRALELTVDARVSRGGAK